MGQSDLTSKFHLIAGSYIAGKIFSEYLCLLKDCFDHKVQGQTTICNRVVEAEAKAIRCVNILAGQLKSIGCDLGVTETEIEGLEDILYSVVTLQPNEQQTVLNLINKLKHERLSRYDLAKVAELF